MKQKKPTPARKSYWTIPMYVSSLVSLAHTRSISVAFMKSLFHWNYIFRCFFVTIHLVELFFIDLFYSNHEIAIELRTILICLPQSIQLYTFINIFTQIKNVHTLNAMSNHIVVVIRNEHKKWNRKKLLRKCEKNANLKRKRSEWTILVNFNHFQYFCLSHDICTCWAERWF